MTDRPELGTMKLDPHVTRSEPTVSVTIRERLNHRGGTRDYRVSRTGETVEVYNWRQSATWTFKRDVAEARSVTP